MEGSAPRVGPFERSPEVLSWAADDGESGSLRQAQAASQARGVSPPVVLMPDAHFGLGASVGSVVATEGTIIPSAVGVDIGCGMAAAETNIKAEWLADDLSPLLSRLRRRVPVFEFGRSGTWRQPPEAADWMRAHPVPSGSGKPGRTVRQLGTLGRGNHFLEFSVGESGFVWIVLHSGSRGIGHRLATRHIKTAALLDEAAPDPDLAAFAAGTPEFDAYVADMLWAQDYALANRDAMLDAALRAFDEARVTGKARPEARGKRITCHHNYAALEHHDGREKWITRKGAIRARSGDYGIIPGSMGTSTYLVEGLGNPASYCSAAHGAGRAMSRGQARRKLSVDDFKQAMGNRCWQDRSARRLLDEAPAAYKDIHGVMTAQADLCRPIDELQAVLNYKGV